LTPPAEDFIYSNSVTVAWNEKNNRYTGTGRVVLPEPSSRSPFAGRMGGGREKKWMSTQKTHSWAQKHAQLVRNLDFSSPQFFTVGISSSGL